MAVLTLHSINHTRRPRAGAAPLHMGNFIDLGTEEVVLMQNTDRDQGVGRLRKLLRRIGNTSAPPPADFAGGSILVTDASSLDLTDNEKARLKVRVAIVQDKPWEEDIGGAGAFGEERLLFDKMTYEDVKLNGVDDAPGTMHPVNGPDLEWISADLTEPAFKLGIGTRFVLQFNDPKIGRRARYFRFLVHWAGDKHDSSVPVNQRQKVVLQFEELSPHRVIVPLGIDLVDGDFQIVTSKDIPSHFVNEDTRELMWSIRPARRDYAGNEIYDRPFPVAKVVFRTRVPIEGTPDFRRKEFTEHPPAWAGTARQRSLTSRSYMNTTYSILVNHGERLRPHVLSTALRDPYKLLEPGDTGYDPAPGADNSRIVSTTHYKYNLYMVDGSALEIRDYDPGTDVEDQM